LLGRDPPQEGTLAQGNSTCLLTLDKLNVIHKRVAAVQHIAAITVAAYSVFLLQSLVLVFAQLMQTQMTAVLDFLSSVPSPTGRPALEFVLTEWCSKQHLFVGEYERKVR